MTRALPRTLPRWAGWLIGVGLVAASWGVAAITPTDDDAQAPFFIDAALGTLAEGRNIAATVLDVRRADTVVGARGWSAEGNWIVVDLEVEAVRSEWGANLSTAELVVGDRTFRASERPQSLLRQSLAAGIPRAGSLAFELPADLTTGTASLQLALSGDTRLDSVIRLEFDLDDVGVEHEAEVAQTEWANP